MLISDHRLDFDGDPLELVEAAFEHADTMQSVRNNQYTRDFLLWNAVLDMADRDNDATNIMLPKIYSIVENKSAKETRALLRKRPFLSWGSRRDEFKGICESQVEVVDVLLDKAGFYDEAEFANKLKILYGTSFMSALPWYEKVIQTDLVQGPYGEPKRIPREAYLLRLALETWAPWEVMVDPYATGLERPGQCRYVIKIQTASKRQIRDAYADGKYPGLDLDRLLEYPRHDSGGHFKDHPWGQQMMAEMGLPVPQGDDDIGILLRYQSEDRYIDVWQGAVTLSDGDNPFSHNLINLSRFHHTQMPNTSGRFWGVGEAKPNEVQASMLDDLYNLMFSAHGFSDQPVIFYREDAVDNVDDLQLALGNRIALKGEKDRPISDSVFIDRGQGLPADHYLLTDRVERNMDLTAAEFGTQRGEVESGGERLATEVALAHQEGSARQEASVRRGENVFLKDFTHKILSIVNQSGSIDDYAEILGEERAMEMYTMAPDELPGGYETTFKGSDWVSHLMVKQRNMKEALPLILNSEYAKQYGVLKQHLNLLEFTEKEIAEMLYTEEEMSIINQMAMLAELAMGAQQQVGALGAPGGGGQKQLTTGQPGGRFQANSSLTETRRNNAQTTGAAR